MVDVVALTRKLVGLDTVDKDETAALKLLVPLLEEAGFVVAIAEHEAGRGTLVADWHTELDVPPLCLSGHVDTVPLGAAEWQHSPFGELDGDRLYGRGTSDMKGGVAAIVTAATALAGKTPKRAGVRLVLTAAEETGSHGARYVADSVLDGPSGPLVIAEPTANSVVHGHKGALWLELLATGVTAHGSTPELGENAIYRLARAVTALEGYRFDAGPHPILGAPTLNVGTISGGLNTNSVPDRAVATVDVRTIAGQNHAELAEALARVAGLDLRTLVDLPSVWTDPGDEWAASVAETVRSVTGESGEPRAATFFTDASVLTPALGSVPTVICGPGEPAQAHVTDEWCALGRLAESAEIFTLICRDWCGL
ncbi:M20 family metallopeptidase [Amycolatopsis acidicola]|uniref:M20 family metallopeptidase n=1 Tax=Amycolatopsis acidicola TaxID=2596893 RepID=A0A5N0UXI4_9PSEU|nr:M20 family metallopeptidase [Amycolatopsis acidicola]KAA9158214.1 M20 family metallopeptidase [Amycolatopsis acidicola]